MPAGASSSLLRIGCFFAFTAVAYALAVRPSSRRRLPMALLGRAPQTQPVEELLEVCKTACDEISELIERVYGSINADPSGNVVRKEDLSYLSLADGVVQVRAAPTSTLPLLLARPDDVPN